MAQYKFRYEWFNDDKSAIRYILEEGWNWRDYHAGSRAAAFSVPREPQASVTVIIDVREGDRFPSGAPAHMMTFGNQVTPAFTGNAIVIGLPDDVRPTLPLDTDGTLDAKHGRVYFARDDDEARAILHQLQTDDS